jgi:DNA-binding LacI/PurR family transcriptional regulator
MLTGNIGIIGSEGLHQQQTSYYGQLVRGMEVATVKNGQHLLFLGTGLTWEERSCEKVDGILVAGIEQLPSLVKRLPTGLPVVTALTSVENISSVIADDYQGAKLAVQYLLKKKHQRIACLMEKSPSLPRRRFDGYKDALSEAGITVNPKWFRLTRTVNNKIGQNYMEWGRKQMRSWLYEDWQKTGCTAIFVQNETSAIGVMQALQEESIQVPQQVSVMGFDGTELCDYVSPSLCAMHVPLMQIGAKAVEMLNHQIQNGLEDAQSIAFPLQVREGSSVATAPL